MDEQVTTMTAAAVSQPAKSRQHARFDVRRCQKMLKRSKAADERFRKRAIEGVEFYFDKQWDEDAKRVVEGRGQAAIVINRIKPTVKVVHGLMVMNPTDWLAKPVGKNDDGLAEVATASLKHVARENNVKALRESAYWWSLVYGVGWARTGFYVRDRDPRSEIVQAGLCDPREIRIDPVCREKDLTDCRYIIWSRKADLEDVRREFPEKADLLASLAGVSDPNLADVNPAEDHVNPGVPELGTPAVKDWEYLDDWNFADKEDSKEVKQIVLHELWEKVPTRVHLVEYRDGRKEEVDLNDPMQAATLADASVLRHYDAMVPKVRYYLFTGEVPLHEADSPYDHGRLPFIPLWFERDQYGDPVSFVQSLKDIQREINYRRSKMLHELTNPNIVVSQRMLDTMELDRAGFAEMWWKGGGVFVGDPGDIHIMRDEGMASQQFTLMQDSKNEIQAVSGANDALMGYDGNAKSGVAKQTDIAQSQTMQRPNEANLQLFDKLLGEQLLMLIQQAHTDEWTVRITDNVGQDKFITVNETAFDPETGMTRRLNDINSLKFELEISDQPWTPTLREQASNMLMQMANAEQNPVIRAHLQKMAVEAGNMPERKKLLDLMDQAIQMLMGPGPDPQAQEMQMRAATADIAKTEAEAADKAASAMQKEQQVAQQSVALQAMAGMQPPF